MSEPIVAAEGLTFQLRGDTLTVGPKCDDTTAQGHWVCTSHSQSFEHNLAMHSHVAADSAEHVIAWMCHVHGPEVP